MASWRGGSLIIAKLPRSSTSTHFRRVGNFLCIILISSLLLLDELIHTHLFWFGDLNFRVLKTEELADIAENIQKRLFRRQEDFQRILTHDELNIERQKGFLNYH